MKKVETEIPDDPHSFSKPKEARVSHLQLFLKVDFNTKSIEGKAIYRIQKSENAKEIIFDINGLVIQAVCLNESNPASFRVGDEQPYLGKPLIILIQQNTYQVTIAYKTTLQSAALQWLNPAQTTGKQHPFLFTQSQAILARTWVPCQDTPGVRFTYEAEVQVAPGYLALMSAYNPTSLVPDGVYSFTMPHPIPSYLLALAVGNISFIPIGSRTGVYAEPESLSRAAYEFSDLENMLIAAENLYGEYPWGRYDLLVLPPSFPFGGMENPCLTFVTPTIITGDRSLTSLVAHELAHSWSGNLVTNATWNDFWLNEGFTVYFERRIMEQLYGAEYARMLQVLGEQDLQQTMEELGKTNPDTCLKLNLQNRDPDEGLTEIAYEKGNLFLLTLEAALGRTRFDLFVQEYFHSFKFRSATTEDFLLFLNNFLSEEEKTAVNRQVEPEKWIYKPGVPETAVKISSSRLNQIKKEAISYEKQRDCKTLDTTSWVPQEWLFFLQLLQPALTIDDMQELDEAFQLTYSSNAEIKSIWFKIALEKGYQGITLALKDFLQNTGRRKFVLPLYKILAADPEGKKIAQEIFRIAAPNYHSVTSRSVEKLFS